MKHINIYIWILIAALVSIIQSGCTDLLDQKPQGEWVEGDEGSGGSYQSDVFTLYARVRGYHISSGTTALAIHSFRSEDAEKEVPPPMVLPTVRCSMILNISPPTD